MTHFLYAQVILKDQYVVTSDGDSLATDVYLPDDSGSFPVIFMRTPYDKELRDYGEFFNKYGYAYVIQDVRGKYGSSGTFRAWIDERLDGVESLDWIKSQNWSDGNIGILGSSYSGYAAMQLASTGHPALKAIVNNSGPGDMYTVIFPGGAFHNTAILPWTMAITQNKTRYFPPYESGLSIPDLANYRSLNDGFKANGYTGVFWNYLLKHQTKDAYWDQINLRNTAQINVPILHVSGWYDFICTSALDNYFEITKGQKERGLNPNQEIMVGPWVHDDMKNGRKQVGDVDFGEKVEVGREKHFLQAVEFFDRYLKEKANKKDQPAPVSIFEVGSNEWFTFDKWPETEITSYFLSSTSAANSSNGDGKLLANLPKTRSSDKFIHDPDRPVSTNGGANIHFAFFKEQLGIKDQSELEKRTDILVYTSEVLQNNLNILGKVKAELFVSTDAADADFTAKLVEVKPDGRANIIVEGIRRLSTAKGYDQKVLTERNKITYLTVDLGYIGIEIPKGSKIRLEVAGSNFPKYSLNPGTSKDPLLTKEFMKASQKIHMTAQYPSRLMLPIRNN